MMDMLLPVPPSQGGKMITDRQRIDMVRAYGEVPQDWSDEKVLKYYRAKAARAAERLAKMGVGR